MSAVLLPFILSGCHGRETVRIMTYNVGTFSKFEDSSMRMVSDMVREAGIDVVSMNELDSCTVRTGGVYQLERFASLMGDWQYMFGSAMAYDGGAYGDGLAAGKDAGKGAHRQAVSALGARKVPGRKPAEKHLPSRENRRE